MTLSAIAITLAAAAGASCSAVLGLDAPRLDPCASGEACLDGAAPPKLDAGPVVADGSVAPDAAPDAPRDAAADAGPIDGIRCGGGSSPTIGCAAADPICCLVLDGGSPSYTCDSNASACTGYPITCATNNDCAGNDVCCHYSSSIKCEGETVCASSSLVCDPSGPSDQCPSGWKCSVAFVSGSYSLPYYGCSP